MSKTIVKQGLEGCLVYCSNVPMTIGKTYYEKGGVATCAQQWKTADICKHNPEGRLHSENVLVIISLLQRHHKRSVIQPSPIFGGMTMLVDG